MGACFVAIFTPPEGLGTTGLFVWLTVFVGANLFQQAFTGFCPAAIVMRKVFGFRPAAECSA